MEIQKDIRKISSETLTNRPHARSLFLDEVLDILASPDTKMPLQLDDKYLTDGIHKYELRKALPLLIPSKLQPYFTDRLQVPFNYYSDSFLQYFLLATIKQSGEINASCEEEAAQKHYFRMTDFLSDCKGLTLDVGCDDSALSASFFTEAVQYIGLDPFCIRLEPFRIVGVGEYLPFKDESLDNVIFNTSLDHILDWRQALSQARAALKKEGALYIATYIWSDNATLITDAVHFHHFRLYDILGAFEELQFSECKTKIYESPKGDKHRHGLYIKATKS